MQTLPLSVVIIARNEEANIGRAIQSVQKISSDILVIDSGSTDSTAEIAKAMGATVHQLPWQGYAETKNKGNQLAKNKYILSLDADEFPDETLLLNIRKIFENGRLKTAYRMNRLNHYCRKPIKHGAWYPDWHYRLFNRDDVYWTHTNDVHEKLYIPQQAQTEELGGYLMHYTTETEKYYRDKMLHYAALFAANRKASGKKSDALKAYSSATFRFFKEFILQAGFLDGSAGFNIARAHFLYTRNKYLFA